MKMLRNFKCSETNVIFERLIGQGILMIECKCTGLATRTLSAPKYFGNSCGKSPSTSNRRLK